MTDPNGYFSVTLPAAESQTVTAKHSYTLISQITNELVTGEFTTADANLNLTDPNIVSIIAGLALN